MIYKERPFEYLRRKSPQTGEVGTLFDEGIISNWYKARAFVLAKLGLVSFTPGEDAHLHVIVLDDDPLMLSVVRHVALYSHFVNHDETNPNESFRNRTIISLVSENPDILTELQREEFLCNLPKYCKCSFRGETYNRDSFIDIELEILACWEAGTEPYEEIMSGKHVEKRLVLRKSEVDSYCSSKADEELYFIDTRKAQYTRRMYNLGCEIDNLPYDDIHSVRRYSMALNIFQYSRLKQPIGQIVSDKEWKNADNQSDVLVALSNIFCSDCFFIRYNSMSRCWSNGNLTEQQAWEKYYDLLSKSEHSRWVTEKLILGYRPFSLQERLHDESLVVNKGRRQQYRKMLKDNWKSPAHLDICSFAELRRIDPDTLKYDSFLVLGIPAILKKVGEV